MFSTQLLTLNYLLIITRAYSQTTSVAMYYMGYQFCNYSVKTDKRVSQ